MTAIVPTLERHIPRDEFEAALTLAYIRSEIARWGGMEAYAHEDERHEPGVWTLGVKPVNDAPFDAATLFSDLDDLRIGTIWLVETGSGPVVEWDLGATSNRGDQPNSAVLWPSRNG